MPKKMPKKMTVLGAEHKIALVSFPAIAAILLFGLTYNEMFRFGQIPPPVLLGCGIGLIVVGLTINFGSAFFMMKAFRDVRLLKTGPYGLSRNPMYASFIFLILPGLSLVLNCSIALAASLVLYAAASFFVKQEEQWLAQNFGDEWDKYTNQVGRFFPKVW